MAVYLTYQRDIYVAVVGFVAAVVAVAVAVVLVALCTVRRAAFDVSYCNVCYRHLVGQRTIHKTCILSNFIMRIL